MSIKSRLAAVEKREGGFDPLIVFFKTFYEDKNGNIDYEIWTASISTGPNAGSMLKRVDDETFEDFQARAEMIAKGAPLDAKIPPNMLKKSKLHPTICMKMGCDRIESPQANGTSIKGRNEDGSV